MRSFAHSILILLSLCVLASCSQKKSGVKLEISNNFVFGADSVAAIAKGGLMVWGRSTSGHAFGQSLEDSNEIRLQLDPGTWTFYAMAWDGTTAYDGTVVSPGTSIIFGGKPRCAKSPVTKLESEAVGVDLVLDNNNCNDPAFASSIGAPVGGLGYRELPKLKLNFCSKVGPAIISASQKCGDTFNDPAVVAGKGAVSSFRVTLRNFTGPASGRNFLSGGIKGECIVFNGDNESGPEAAALYGASQSVVPNLPAGGVGFPFHMTVEMYPGSSYCENSGAGFRGVITKELINGATFELPGNNKYFSAGGKYRQYVEVSPEKICATRSGTYADHPFAGGEGTPDRPYLICSVPQFYAINSLSAHMTKSFKLQSNLDFNPYSNGLSNSSPALFGCLELGTNFLPLGYPDAVCTTPGTALSWGTKYPFSGSFFGANFKLQNLRLRAEEKDYIGLFADFQGANLSDIKLDATEISGKSNVGALAGAVSNNAYVSKIDAFKLDIEARDSSVTDSLVGAIFGSASSASIDNIRVYESKVRGEASIIGGIIGYGSNLTASRIASEVDIESNSEAANQMYIGGVFGQVDNSTLKFLKHEGAIYTDATFVGGLIGKAYDTSVTDFYTMSFIHSYDSVSDSKIGGVFGYFQTTTAKPVGRGYSLSLVKTDCPTACTQGPVVGKVAVVSPSYLPMYKLTATETGEDGLPGGFGTDGTDEVVKTPAQLKSATAASLPDLLPATGWVHLAGQYPRFLFEQHPCLLPGLSGSGDGSLGNPYRICNEDQYLSLGNAAYTDKFFKLMANIRLSNANTGASEINDFYAELLGNNKSIIGGSSTYNSAQTGHILNLHGSIRNLKLHGMSRSSSYSGASTPHGVFVARNFGLLQDIQAWTYPTWGGNGSGFVGTNTNGGKIKNVVVDGIFKGQDDFTTLAVINEGEIYGSEASGELRCISDGCTNIAGLVATNIGSIKNTSVQVRLSDMPGAAASASMLVLTNATGATITDVGISPHSEFRLLANGVGYYFHSSNTGSLTRVVNNGKMIDIDNTLASSISTPSDAGTGTHDGVLRSGGRSGKLLLSDATFTCSGVSDNEIAVAGWGSINDAANWNGAYLTGYSVSGDANQKLFIEASFDSMDGHFSQRVSNFTDSAGTGVFTIMAADCPMGETGKASVWYTNDLAVDASGVPLAGVILPQFAPDKNQYLPTATWNNQIWDVENDSADLDEMLAYFKYLLGVSPDPVTPKPWEMSDEGIELFERH